MNIFNKLLHAILQQNFEFLLNSNLVNSIYILIFVILFLENGLLPAAFLPGDSLLILIGILISKNILNFYFTLFLLIVAASLGSWVNFLQGKWLKKNKTIKKWLFYLPVNYYQRAHKMFYRYGLSALLISRFIAFIRTLLPMIAGLSGIRSSYFHFLNWISSFLWVFIFMLIGFIIGKTSTFQYYNAELMLCFMFLPLVFLIVGFVSFIVFILFKKNNIFNKK